jgi:Ca2+-binding RTX toxin-like protein
MTTTQFTPNEENITPGQEVSDPEYNQLGSQVAWQDLNGANLWVAPVDPLTGEILLNQKQLLDTGLAPIPELFGGTGSGNGPEWIYTENGQEILYTKATGSSQSSWELYSARWNGTAWETGLLVGGGNGLGPIGTLDPGDPNPRIIYGQTNGTTGGLYWRNLNDSTGGLISSKATSPARWVNDESDALVFTEEVNGVNQVFYFDINTETKTQITFSNIKKKDTWMFEAPEYNNELVMFATETVTGKPDVIGIYTQVNGVWTKVNELRPPSQFSNIRSAEPVVYNGLSYITFVAENSQGGPSEIWIAGIDPTGEPFYRQVSDPSVTMQRNDPETFISDEGLVVTYVGPNKELYKAETGLGLPGDDTYFVDNLGDVISDSNGGIDTVKSSVSWTLGGEFENLILTGTANINGTGNALDNVLTGNSGNNILTGGLGNDTYVVNKLGDSIIELANEGIDTVHSSISWTLGNNLENLTLTGTANINGTGNSLDNVLTGNSGKNTLTGDLGADTLIGGLGVDTLNGGAGKDKFTGGKGNDTLLLGSGDGVADIVFYASGDGRDTVRNFVRGNGGDLLSFSGIKSIDVVRVGADTQLRVGDGISGNAGFGKGATLITLVGVIGFTANDLKAGGFNVDASNTATFRFS